jgi:NADP-dependent 3-hydroxy acid dehydrogenase YdfG
LDNRAIVARYSKKSGFKVGAFEGQTVVITGGGSGVGAAIALSMAKEKASLYLIGRRPEMLESVAERARRLGADVRCLSADLGSETGQRELALRLVSDLRQVDILVHNAAMYVAGAIDRASLDDFDRHYRTNVRAPFALTQALLPMLKARRGQIVFINSSSGKQAKPLSSQYDSTKHALRAIADSVRGEVNAEGVRVLSVYLGRTASEMQEQIHRQEGKPYRPERLLQPEDVAFVILSALTVPRTAEVTDIHIRPMVRS